MAKKTLLGTGALNFDTKSIHLAGSSTCLFPAFAFAGLFIVPVRAHFAHDTFFIQFFLQSAERLFDGFASSYFHFNHVTFTPL